MNWKEKRNLDRAKLRKRRDSELENKLKKISKVDLSYLAGIVDGEGCIWVNRTNGEGILKTCKRGYSYRSGLAIAMTSLELLTWVCSIVELGQIRKYKKIKGCKQAWSRQASIFLKVLLPFLKLKKPQAENQISFQSSMGYPGSKGVTKIEWNRREQHRRKSLLLNKRGT